MRHGPSMVVCVTTSRSCSRSRQRRRQLRRPSELHDRVECRKSSTQTKRPRVFHSWSFFKPYHIYLLENISGGEATHSETPRRVSLRRLMIPASIPASFLPQGSPETWVEECPLPETDTLPLFQRTKFIIYDIVFSVNIPKN